MSVSRHQISAEQAQRIVSLEEGHFLDHKSIDIQPAKLTEAISAFANADGGELYIGIDEVGDGSRRWRGFSDMEAANGHIQAFMPLFPLGTDFEYSFLAATGQPGLVLQISVRKTAGIKKASDGNIYVRRSAQKIKLTTPDEIRRLEFSKGLQSFETELTTATPANIIESEETKRFIAEVVPKAEAEPWLRKQQLVQGEKITVGGVLLFSDEPQAILPKRCGIKIYRYKTTEKQGTRDTLAFTPLTIEGPSYGQIAAAVAKTIEVVQQARTMGAQGLEEIDYPKEAIHEILTNAVIHRDYSVADDIHVRVFDNRVEIESPGKLPAHITPENILDERFARNGTLVRLLNKYPDPPNKDVGEGLNTAFHAMRKLGLKDPLVANRENSVLVTIRHERLASYEELILSYLEKNPTIKNKQARDICFVDADYKMKRTLSKLEDRKLIEKVPGRPLGATIYRKGPKFKGWRKRSEQNPGGKMSGA